MLARLRSAYDPCGHCRHAEASLLLYVPATHAVQFDERAVGETLPCSHGVHAPALAALKLPAGQSRHVLAAKSEYLPAAQLWQLVLPCSCAYVPARQESHVLAAGSEVLPNGQLLHAAALLPLNVPLMHGKQLAELAVDHLPASQSVHRSAPAALYVPASHVLQSPDPVPAASRYLPATQSVHDDELDDAAGPCLPLGHDLQSDSDGRDGVSLYVEAGQALHAACDVIPTTSEYVPDGHALQLDREVPTASSHVPSGHGMHAASDAEAADEYVPSGHNMQRSASALVSSRYLPAAHGWRE